MVLVDGLGTTLTVGKGEVAAAAASTAGIPTALGLPPKAYREFEASVIILHHQTTIAVGYQPVIHSGVMRQSAEIISIEGREALRTGEKARVRFRFAYFAEYLIPGSTFIFREGRAKGIGTIIETFPAPTIT
jgi:GTPase